MQLKRRDSPGALGMGALSLTAYAKWAADIEYPNGPKV